MISLSRNYWDACKSFALDYVRGLKNKFHPNILILLETHVQSIKLHVIHWVVNLDYNVECISSIGYLGGILFFQKDSLGEIDFIEINQQFSFVLSVLSTLACGYLWEFMLATRMMEWEA